MDDRVREQLLARSEADQQARASIPLHHSIEEWDHVVGPVDADNEQWLRDVISRYGWPGVSLVGEDGAHAAWLLVQHAPLDLQERCLLLMTQAIENGEASPAHRAYLIDRVRQRRGEPQLFGTQYRIEGDDVRPYPIEDPDRLDQRRAQVGLGPHSEYDAGIRHRHRHGQAQSA